MRGRPPRQFLDCRARAGTTPGNDHLAVGGDVLLPSGVQLATSNPLAHDGRSVLQ